MDNKEKIVELFKEYWYYSVIALLLAILLVGGSIKSTNEKNTKKEIEFLHKENKKLQNTLVEIRDSIDILHKAALEAKYQDTIYIDKIEWLKTKTNEEISHFNTLNPDSQYIVFSDLLTEYSKTRFNQDSI